MGLSQTTEVVLFTNAIYHRHGKQMIKKVSYSESRILCESHVKVCSLFFSFWLNIMLKQRLVKDTTITSIKLNLKKY